MAVVSQAEIEFMIKNIEKVPSIINLRPNQIADYYTGDEIERIDSIIKLLDKIFVKRLEILASKVARQTQSYYPSYKLGAVSINERITILRRFLKEKNVDITLLNDIYPSKEEEVDLLAKAHELGYDILSTWSIQETLEGAENYLIEHNKEKGSDNNSIRIA